MEQRWNFVYKPQLACTAGGSASRRLR